MPTTDAATRATARAIQPQGVLLVDDVSAAATVVVGVDSSVVVEGAVGATAVVSVSMTVTVWGGAVAAGGGEVGVVSVGVVSVGVVSVGVVSTGDSAVVTGEVSVRVGTVRVGITVTAGRVAVTVGLVTVTPVRVVTALPSPPPQAPSRKPATATTARPRPMSARRRSARRRSAMPSVRTRAASVTPRSDDPVLEAIRPPETARAGPRPRLDLCKRLERRVRVEALREHVLDEVVEPGDRVEVKWGGTDTNRERVLMRKRSQRHLGERRRRGNLDVPQF
jgi:hypothetical protein